MHSSRMCTARRSSCHGGLHTPLEQTPPSEQAPPSPWLDPTQLPPWVWAWTRSPSTSPLAVGLDQIPSASPLGVSLDQLPLNFSLGCGPGPDPHQLPPWVWAWKPAKHAGIPPPPGDLLQGILGYHPPSWTDRHL